MNVSSPAAAIAWEIWRKNRWGFLVVFVSTLCGLAVHLFGPAEDDVLQFIAGTSMVASFLVTFAIFSYADSGGRIAFPIRTFTLPVRTGRLVNSPILLGAVAITVVHLAWGLLFLRQLNYPLDLFTIYWAVALMTFQATIWCLADCPKSFVVALTLELTLFVRLAVVLAGNDDPARAVICLLIILPVAYSCARLGIRQQRRGQWQFPAKAQLLMDIATRKLFSAQQPFASGPRAQLWMEWRRNAGAPLISLGIGLVVICACFAQFVPFDDVGEIGAMWFYFTCALLTLWAFVSSVLMARDTCSKSLALSSFLATRPVTSGELAFAKIRLAVGVSLAGWCVYAGAFFCWFNFFGANPDLPIVRWDYVLVPTTCFAALSLAWHLFGALPLWQTGRVESPAWAGLLLLGGYIVLGNVLQFLDKQFGLLAVLPSLLTVGLISKILIAVWAFSEGIHRRLLSARTVLKYLAFWLVVTACLVGIASALCRGTILQPLSALGAALLLPLARVALAPLAVAGARHR